MKKITLTILFVLIAGQSYSQNYLKNLWGKDSSNIVVVEDNSTVLNRSFFTLYNQHIYDLMHAIRQRGYSADDFASLAAAIDTAAIDTAMVIVASRQSIAETAPDTLPKTASLFVRQGGRIKITRKFRIEGHFIDPGPIQIFEGNLDSVEFAPGSVDYVRPEWFGAVNDSSINSTVSFNAALKSITPNSIPIILQYGSYRADSIIYSITDTTDGMQPGLIFYGAGMNRTRIYSYATSGYALKIIGTNRLASDNKDGHLHGTIVKNVSFWGIDSSDSYGTTSGIFMDTWFQATFENVMVRRFPGNGIELNRDVFNVGVSDDHGLLTRIINCYIAENGGHGIVTPGAEAIDNILIENTSVSLNSNDGFHGSAWHFTLQNSFIGGNGGYGVHIINIPGANAKTFAVDFINLSCESNVLGNFNIEGARTVNAIGIYSQQRDISGSPSPQYSVILGGDGTYGNVGNVSWIGGVFDASVSGATAFRVLSNVASVRIFGATYNNNITTIVDTSGINSSTFIYENQDYRHWKRGLTEWRFLASTNNPAVSFMEITGSSPRLYITGDGVLQFSADGGSPDVTLRRHASNLLGTGGDDEFRASGGLEVNSAGYNVINSNGAYYRQEVDVASSTTPTFDLSLGNVFLFTFPAGNITPTFLNPLKGQFFELHLRQDATGGRTISWPSNFKFPGGTAPTLTATGNALDILVFTYVQVSNEYRLISYQLDVR